MKSSLKRSALALALVVMTLSFALVTFAVPSATGNERTSCKKVIARRLPRDYSADFQFVCRNGSVTKFCVACAEPQSAPVATHTPPYAKLFLLKLEAKSAHLLWSTDLGYDNLCMQISASGYSRLGSIVNVVSRPYSGSVSYYHLRLFRHNKNSKSLNLVRQIDYTDGVSVKLTSSNSNWPAFLVYEPTYKLDKYPAQFYRFRLYTPTSAGSYRLTASLLTRKRYDMANSAYHEVLAKLRKHGRSLYKLPISVPEESAVEKIK